MRKFRYLVVLLCSLALFATACGSDGAATSLVDQAQDAATDAAEGAAEAVEDAAETVTDAMDEDEPEDTMEEEAPVSSGDCPSDVPSELNVAYFSEWPTANQVQQANQGYDAALCTTVNWLPFASGNEMSLAMEAGDVDIAYSQGLTPFANAVTSGADLELVGIAVTYADADQCIVHPDHLDIMDDASNLEGESVYSPIGNVTHFQMLTQLDALGVDAGNVNIIPSEGGAAAVAAFESGDVAMACAFGGSVLAMLDAGGVRLNTFQEKEAMGIRVFDIVSIPASFGESSPETVTAFLQVTEDANGAYNAGRDQAMEEIIAGAAGMELGPTQALLDQFGFPTTAEQLSDAWMGGTVADVMAEQMAFFQEQGEIDEALGDYSGFINTSFINGVEQTAMPAMADVSGSCPSDVPSELNVAYFSEWPTANQVQQANQGYDAALCTTVNWLPFASGNEMSLAMEAGDVDISYSQGLTPFANAVTSGADLSLVGIAVTYADADQCIVHPDHLDIMEDASNMEGESVYSPIGNVTHFQLLTQMDALGVDAGNVNIIPSEGGAAAVAAFESGDVAVACAFGGSVLAMLDAGGVRLSTAAEKEAMGIRVFDIVSIPTGFGESSPETVAAFLQITEDANAAYNAGRDTAMEEIIAGAAGMELEPTQKLLDQFGFPPASAQLSDAWMGATVADVMAEQMAFFEDQGEIDDALSDYSGFVDTSFLETVSSAPALAPAAACPSDVPSELNVAYFSEWPTANQVQQANQGYDAALCTTVNWLPFASGNEMSLAMEAGDVDISYSQGLTPFANAVTSGADLELVGIAVTYADADQCIVHPDHLDIMEDASNLEGESVYSPIGNVTHFQLLTQMDALGVDAGNVNIIPSEGGAAAVAAFESGDVAMACAFGGSVLAMIDLGGVRLNTFEEKEAMGIRVFDIVSIPAEFGVNSPETVTAFLQITSDANDAYNSGRDTAMEEIIAGEAGMELGPTQALLDQFGFPGTATQLSDDWMGKTVAAVMLEQMEFFQDQGEIDDALGDYSGFINTSFLEGVN